MTPENPYVPPASSIELPGSAPALEVPEDILKKIRSAWVAALVSASFTLLFVLIALSGKSILGFSGWEIIDVVFVMGLAFGIYKKSRVCAVLMLTYFVFAKFLLIAQGASASSLPMALIFIYFFWQGVAGTFAYHALKKRAQAEAANG